VKVRDIELSQFDAMTQLKKKEAPADGHMVYGYSLAEVGTVN
jgi:hypothetical protein